MTGAAPNHQARNELGTCDPLLANDADVRWTAGPSHDRLLARQAGRRVRGGRYPIPEGHMDANTRCTLSHAILGRIDALLPRVLM